jgi:hypothetical protein
MGIKMLIRIIRGSVEKNYPSDRKKADQCFIASIFFDDYV